jgi:hypothetical protein
MPVDHDENELSLSAEAISKRIGADAVIVIALTPNAKDDSMLDTRFGLSIKASVGVDPGVVAEAVASIVHEIRELPEEGDGPPSKIAPTVQ